MEQPFGRCRCWTTTIICFGNPLELTSFSIEHAIQMRKISYFNHQNSPLCLITQPTIEIHVYSHESDKQQWTDPNSHAFLLWCDNNMTRNNVDANIEHNLPLPSHFDRLCLKGFKDHVANQRYHKWLVLEANLELSTSAT